MNDMRKWKANKVQALQRNAKYSCGKFMLIDFFAVQ